MIKKSNVGLYIRLRTYNVGLMYGVQSRTYEAVNKLAMLLTLLYIYVDMLGECVNLSL